MQIWIWAIKSWQDAPVSRLMTFCFYTVEPLQTCYSVITIPALHPFHTLGSNNCFLNIESYDLIYFPNWKSNRHVSLGIVLRKKTFPVWHCGPSVSEDPKKPPSQLSDGILRLQKGFGLGAASVTHWKWMTSLGASAVKHVLDFLTKSLALCLPSEGLFPFWIYQNMWPLSFITRKLVSVLITYF